MSDSPVPPPPPPPPPPPVPPPPAESVTAEPVTTESVTTERVTAEPATEKNEPESWETWWGFFPVLATLGGLVYAFGDSDVVWLRVLVRLALPAAIAGWAVVVGVRWLRSEHRFERAFRWWRTTLANSGGGFYGFVSLIVFAYLEARMLLEALQEAGDWMAFLNEQAMQTVFGFSTASIMNGISAMMWPFTLWTDYGLQALPAVGIAWLVYRGAVALIERYVPLPEIPEDEKTEEDDF